MHNHRVTGKLKEWMWGQVSLSNNEDVRHHCLGRCQALVIVLIPHGPRDRFRLQVILLEDRETVHNSFFDRTLKP